MIKNVLNWLKSNPITTLCAVVVVVSLGSFYYPIYWKGSQFRSELTSRQQTVSELESFESQSVQIPPAAPDEPPTDTQMVINDAAINKLQRVYKQLESEYSEIYQEATRLNKAGHEVMLSGLFPQPMDNSRQFRAREAYRDQFRSLYEALNAGSKPGPEAVQEMLDQTESDLRSSYLLSETERLSEDQQRELRKRQAERLVDLYKQTASEHHVYAEPVKLDPRTGEWQTGPFQIGDWAKGRKPPMEDLWEGQMQLWIQQDLVRALRMVNNMQNPDTSLREVPVKRVKKMLVKPGYVGVPEGGRIRGGVPDESKVQEIVEKMQQAKQSRLPADFTISPTGRKSNPVYDVRHAVLTLVIDSQRIPQLFNAISSVNFMTIIGMDITDVDEYEAMRDGYYYGSDDAVELDLTVETLWLRSWTAGHLTEQIAADQNEQFDEGLMPDEVRYTLGLPVRSSNFVPPSMRRDNNNSSNNRNRGSGGFNRNF